MNMYIICNFGTYTFLFSGGYKEIIRLKEKNPHLKILISLGGAIKSFSDLGSDAYKRGELCKSVLNFLKQHGFDGIDLDWKNTEYPPGKPPDR